MGAGYEAVREMEARREAYAKQEAADLQKGIEDAEAEGENLPRGRFAPDDEPVETSCSCGAPLIVGGCADAFCVHASPNATVTMCDGCDDLKENVKRVAFRREEGGEILGARWCDDGEGSCLDLARAAQRGFKSFGAVGLEPVLDLIVWTDHVNTCGTCKRRFRVSQQYIDASRADAQPPESFPPDEDIATWAEHCIECVSGGVVPGEIVELVEPVDCAHPFLAFRIDTSSGYHVAGYCRTCKHEGPQVIGTDKAREAFYASLEADTEEKPGYYYEHVNGSVHRKPFNVVETGGGPDVYFDSPMVERWWKVEADGS